MIDKDWLLFIFGVIATVLGWLMSRKVTELEKADEAHRIEIASLKESKAEMRIHISENYIKRSEIKDLIERIDRNINEIFQELKTKANK